MGLAPRSFLSAFAVHPLIKREKTQGRFVYYSSDIARYNGQRQKRILMKTIRLPTDFEAVAILVEKIKNPALTDAELSRRLRKQRMFVEPEMIQNLFVHHDLTTKKTPHSI